MGKRWTLWEALELLHMQQWGPDLRRCQLGTRGKAKHKETGADMVSEMSTELGLRINA